MKNIGFVPKIYFPTSSLSPGLQDANRGHVTFRNFEPKHDFHGAIHDNIFTKIYKNTTPHDVDGTIHKNIFTEIYTEITKHFFYGAIHKHIHKNMPMMPSVVAL